MSRDQWGVLAGVAVLIAAVFTIATWSRVPDPAQTPAASAAVATTVTSLSEVSADLTGVPPSVQRVLFDSGWAIAANPTSLQIPPTVARVLIEYGVPLMVPTAQGSGQ